MKTEELKIILKNYLEPSTINYAFLINGDWGCGKTYFIKNFFENDYIKEEYKKPILISLYGIKNTTEIKERSVESFIGQSKVGEVKANNKVTKYINGITEIIKSADTSLPINVFDAVNTFAKAFIDPDKHILVFDDLERCLMPINEVLGFINNYVENDNYKVIILANEDEIIKKTHSENLELKYITTLINNKDTDKIDLKSETNKIFAEQIEYKIIKEKLIGRTINFVDYFDENLVSTIENISINSEVDIIIKNNIDRIKEIIKEVNFRNLRSLNYAIDFFASFYEAMKYLIDNYIKNANPIIDENIILEEFFIAILEITLKINKNGTVEKDCKYNIFGKDYNTPFYNSIITFIDAYTISEVELDKALDELNGKYKDFSDVENFKNLNTEIVNIKYNEKDYLDKILTDISTKLNEVAFENIMTLWNVVAKMVKATIFNEEYLDKIFKIIQGKIKFVNEDSSIQDINFLYTSTYRNILFLNELNNQDENQELENIEQVILKYERQIESIIKVVQKEKQVDKLDEITNFEMYENFINTYICFTDDIMRSSRLLNMLLTDDFIKVIREDNIKNICRLNEILVDLSYKKEHNKELKNLLHDFNDFFVNLETIIVEVLEKLENRENKKHWLLKIKELLEK